jgi:hypothetical protein
VVVLRSMDEIHDEHLLPPADGLLQGRGATAAGRLVWARLRQRTGGAPRHQHEPRMDWAREDSHGQAALDCGTVSTARLVMGSVQWPEVDDHRAVLTTAVTSERARQCSRCPPFVAAGKGVHGGRGRASDGVRGLHPAILQRILLAMRAVTAESGGQPGRSVTTLHCSVAAEKCTVRYRRQVVVARRPWT